MPDYYGPNDRPNDLKLCPERNRMVSTFGQQGGTMRLKCLSSDGHMYTYDELKDNLRQVVENTKIEVKLAEYVMDLRTRFFIDEKTG